MTAEQKAHLIEGVSKLLLDVLNKPMNPTFVVIDEVDVEKWGWGGLPVEEHRKPMAASALLPDTTKLESIAKEWADRLYRYPMADIVPAGAGSAVPER